MDEVKIYNPMRAFPNTIPVTSKPKIADYIKSKSEEVKAPKKSKAKISRKNSKWKYFFDWKLWKEVFDEGDNERRELNAKYPWFPIMYNWLIVVIVLVLFVSFGIWSIDIHTEKTAIAYATAVAEQKDAEHQAFIAQQEADRKAAEESLENLMKTNAQVKAKLGYGSRNFIDKYHYGDSDIMTLYQCLDNRMNNSMYTGMTIDEIAFQEGQFIASYDTNPVQDYYFNLAMKSERLKNDRVSDPVGTDYVYTIYTEHGLYLANDPKAPAYTWWHYSE